jgi:hypothetical protein
LKKAREIKIRIPGRCNMIKFIKLFIIVLFLSGFIYIYRTEAATINAASPSYSDVSSAVSSATYGDTVVVPDGTATWNTSLTISKGITLQGAGIDNTVINNGRIIYSPDSYSRSNNIPVRITGFTIDADWNGPNIQLSGPLGDQSLIENNRIDHNKLIDGTMAGVYWGWNGRFWGLVDNNQFIDCHTTVRTYDNYWYGWDMNPMNLGSGEGIVIEDNTMTWTGARPLQNLLSSGHGMRYTFRFNTLTNIPRTSWIEGLDHHGNIGDVVNYGSCSNCSTGNYYSCCTRNRATRYSEIYGNYFTLAAGSGNTFRVFGMHGSTSLMYENDVTPNGASVIIGIGNSSASGDEVEDTYMWKNTTNGSNEIVPSGTGESGPQPVQNVDYWKYNAGFNGTSGVGVGTLAQMQTITTCTGGVGFWVTDQGNWNTKTPEPDGVLYRCGSSNNWELYYTPCTYPHPLRGDAVPDTTPPSDITSVNDGTGGDVDFTYSTTELSANWTQSTDDESGISKYWYAIGDTPGSTGVVEWTSTSNGTVTSVTRSSLLLTVGVTYYFTVKAENWVSLQSNPKSSDGQAVIEGTDDTPPVISDVNAVNIVETGATITWNTDEPATSQVEYGLSLSYGDVSAEDSNLVTSHSVELTNLTAGTQYHYAVISRDAMGNESISLDKTFTTLSETEEPKEEIDAKAYPNPYSFSKGNSMRFSVDSTTGGEVKIYTISGKLVKKLLIASGESEVNWDVLNEEGNNIKAGLYLYTITDGEGNKKTGKLAISH